MVISETYEALRVERQLLPGGSAFVAIAQCHHLQLEPRGMNVSIQLGGGAFYLGPDGEDGAIGQFGEGGITDRPAGRFGGAVGQQDGFAPGDAFVSREAEVHGEAQGHGAGIVRDDERADVA